MIDREELKKEIEEILANTRVIPYQKTLLKIHLATLECLDKLTKDEEKKKSNLRVSSKIKRDTTEN